MEMSEEQIKELHVRNRIVEGARQSFFEYGFSRVTMDEIAENLGMSKKTLYKHFSSKEDLLKSVITSHCNGMDVRVQPIMENTTTDFIEKMLIMGPIIAENIAKIPVLFLKDLEKNSPETWREYQEWRRSSIIANFGKFLTEGIQQGVFRNDLHVEGVVTMYLTIIEGMFRSEVLSKLPLTPAQVYTMIARVLTEGIIDESARKEFFEKTRPAMSAFSLSI
jgi:AcrR family transcriptional regulator